MPVRGDRVLLPKYEFIVLVTAIASPFGARIEMCAVPLSSIDAYCPP